jgi:N-methylhydantoinase A
MDRALRVISVERGYDPREFTLISFGGAGGLHAADLARRLNIPKVLIPPFAATLSAFGMLTADVIKDYTQTIMLPGNTPDAHLRSRFDPLINKGIQQIKSEGFTKDQIRIEKMLDVRYRGQSFELTIPYHGMSDGRNDIAHQFGQTHKKIYGYDRTDVHIEIVNLRVRATGIVSPPRFKRMELWDSNPSDALINSREVYMENGKLEIPCFRGETLHPGNKINGPAIVIRKDTTILVGNSDIALVDPWGNLVINIDKQTNFQ